MGSVYGAITGTVNDIENGRLHNASNVFGALGSHAALGFVGGSVFGLFRKFKPEDAIKGNTQVRPPDGPPDLDIPSGSNRGPNDPPPPRDPKRGPIDPVSDQAAPKDFKPGGIALDATPPGAGQGPPKSGLEGMIAAKGAQSASEAAGLGSAGKVPPNLGKEEAVKEAQKQAESMLKGGRIPDEQTGKGGQPKLPDATPTGHGVNQSEATVGRNIDPTNPSAQPKAPGPEAGSEHGVGGKNEKSGQNQNSDQTNFSPDASNSSEPQFAKIVKTVANANTAASIGATIADAIGTKPAYFNGAIDPHDWSDGRSFLDGYADKSKVWYPQLDVTDWSKNSRIGLGDYLRDRITPMRDPAIMRGFADEMRTEMESWQRSNLTDGEKAKRLESVLNRIASNNPELKLPPIHLQVKNVAGAAGTYSDGKGIISIPDRALLVKPGNPEFHALVDTLYHEFTHNEQDCLMTRSIIDKYESKVAPQDLLSNVQGEYRKQTGRTLQSDRFDEVMKARSGQVLTSSQETRAQEMFKGMQSGQTMNSNVLASAAISIRNLNRGPRVSFSINSQR